MEEEAEPLTRTRLILSEYINSILTLKHTRRYLQRTKAYSALSVQIRLARLSIIKFLLPTMARSLENYDTHYKEIS